MELIGIGNQQDRKHKEEQDMSQNEIGSEESKLGDFAKEFTARLGECVPSHRVPFTSPPGNVGGVSLELTSESKGDDELEEETLNGDHSDHASKSPRETEAFQEHHDNEEDQKHDDSNGVRNCGKDSTELLTAHAEKRTRTTSQGEEASENTSIDADGAESNDRDTNQSTSSLGCLSGAEGVGVVLLVAFRYTSLSIDEEVRDDGDGDQDQRTKHLSHEDVGEGRTRNVSRKLGRWVSKSLTLVTSDTSSGQTAVADP